MHFTICAHFLVVRHFARPLWQPAPPTVAGPVASQPKLRLHSPPLIHQYFPNIIFIISVIFPSLFHFFSQSIFASSKPCASSKRSCTTLPPSINTSINNGIVTSVTFRSTCICLVSKYSITISMYHSTDKECCHQFSGSYEYLGNAAASINLKKTLTFTSPYH